MVDISHSVENLLNHQHYVIVSSFDREGEIHTSAKGVVDVDRRGRIYILDLYKGRTYANIIRNPNVTLTTIDDRTFKGYSIQGKAKIIDKKFVSRRKMQLWHERLAKRIAKRIVRHVREETSGRRGIPEARFPIPRYLIEVSIRKIIDLAPERLRSV